MALSGGDAAGARCWAGMDLGFREDGRGHREGRYCIHLRLRGRSCFVMAADVVFRGGGRAGQEGGERRGSRVLGGGYGRDGRNRKLIGDSVCVLHY